MEVVEVVRRWCSAWVFRRRASRGNIQGTRADNQGTRADLRLQPEGIEVVQVGRPERGGVGDLTEQPAAEARAARRGHELQVEAARHGVRRTQRRGALEAPGAQLCGGGGGGVDEATG